MKSYMLQRDNEVVLSLNYASTLTYGDACELIYMILREVAVVDDFEIPEHFSEIVTNCDFMKVNKNGL